jgi:hypothetical protein
VLWGKAQRTLLALKVDGGAQTDAVDWERLESAEKQILPWSLQKGLWSFQYLDF